MKEIYYSEELKKLLFEFFEELKKYFDSKDECIKTEEAYQEKHAAELKAKEERATAAKEVDEAYKTYINLRSDFIKKYGSYHCTLTEKDVPGVKYPDIFSWLASDAFWF